MKKTCLGKKMKKGKKEKGVKRRKKGDKGDKKGENGEKRGNMGENMKKKVKKKPVGPHKIGGKIISPDRGWGKIKKMILM